MQEKIPFIETTKRLLITDGKKGKKKHFWKKIFSKSSFRSYRILALTVAFSVLVILSVFVIGSISNVRGDNLFDKIAQTILSSSILGGELSSESESAPPETEPQKESESETELPKETEAEIESETASPESETSTNAPEKEEPTLDVLYDFDYSRVPEDEYPIVPADLSLYMNGTTYINNSTGYKPDTAALLNSELKDSSFYENLSNKKEPLVLIVHTHGTEAYSPEGAISYSDEGEIARSQDKNENVVSLGAIMADILEKHGIATLHCTVMHDSVQYRESYSRAEKTIKEYLKKYPSIKLVIDLHRDAVVKSNGEMIRPVTLVDGKECAQVMCVVGSDWGGDKCEYWRDNLALALKLRESLNSRYINLCRPTDLRPNTYNQELSRYSLLLEIGAAGNNLTEAKFAARLVAQAIADLWKEM